jgi:hypothetical protein
MAQDGHEMLELLKFELKFVEDGGYGRSPRTPWRPPYILEDSPSCPNLGDPARPHPCIECRLIAVGIPVCLVPPAQIRTGAR